MQIARLRRGASTSGRLLRSTLHSENLVHWNNGHWRPLLVFAADLKIALHEGIVGKHEAFWGSIIKAVVAKVAPTEVYVVQTLMELPTLFTQVTWLVDEVAGFPGQPVVRTHNRFKTVVAFCDAMKAVSHPNL